MNELEKPGTPIDGDVYEALENTKATRDKQSEETGVTDEDVANIEMQITKEKEDMDEKLEDVRKKLDDTEYTPENTL